MNHKTVFFIVLTLASIVGANHLLQAGTSSSTAQGGTTYHMRTDGMVTNMTAATSNLEFSNNIYTTNPSWGFLHGTVGLKFKQWKTHGHDTYGSKKADPKFVSADNLHLKSGSPAIDQGSLIQVSRASDISKDLDAIPIFPPPDIGAYEFQPVLT